MARTPVLPKANDVGPVSALSGLRSRLPPEHHGDDSKPSPELAAVRKYGSFPGRLAPSQFNVVPPRTRTFLARMRRTRPLRYRFLRARK
jgi:hypothetical protein